jgi:hypothetical protein
MRLGQGRCANGPAGRTEGIKYSLKDHLLKLNFLCKNKVKSITILPRMVRFRIVKMALSKQTVNIGCRAFHRLAFVILPVIFVLITGCSEVSRKPLEPSAVSFSDKCAPIFKTFVDDKGMVDYKALKRKKVELNRLLNDFAKLDPNEYNSWSKEDKIALWLNAYNIKLLKIIVDNYPIESQRILRVLWGPDSIRHINGIWDKYKFVVMDEEFTLKEIDQRFFRKEFDEPRVFFGVSCASISGPPLRNEPYYGYKLYKQLDDQAKKFLSNPLAFRIDRERRVVNLSAIFLPTWYGDEFISKYGTDKKFKDQQPSVRAVLNFVINYIPENERLFLEIENYSVKYITYNWTLNDSSLNL